MCQAVLSPSVLEISNQILEAHSQPSLCPPPTFLSSSCPAVAVLRRRVALGSREAKPSTTMALQIVADVGITYRQEFINSLSQSDCQLLPNQEIAPAASLALAPTWLCNKSFTELQGINQTLQGKWGFSCWPSSLQLHLPDSSGKQVDCKEREDHKYSELWYSVCTV